MNEINNVRAGSNVKQQIEQTAKVNSTTSPGPPLHRFLRSAATLEHAELLGEEITISEKQLVQAIEKAIKELSKSTSLEFSVHEGTQRIMVKVLDQQNGEMIREIPPEKNLDFLQKLWEMAGIFVDEKG
ncbi:flagellar protein FlaG [Longirhabdus pacifica]|uniref:flagellar protein FlaG n=1 Tax=Longirhabdus pacifica TaxID=2305227 RepID=UPI001008774F|nr:flagellar protein FlaG [Longirhabdus pacifica]